MVYESARKRLSETCSAIDKILPKIKEEIKEKNTVDMCEKWLAKQMGSTIEKEARERTIYLETSYCLFNKGIYTTAKKYGIISMRTRTPDDKLPWTLRRMFDENFKDDLND